MACARRWPGTVESTGLRAIHRESCNRSHDHPEESARHRARITGMNLRWTRVRPSNEKECSVATSEHSDDGRESYDYCLQDGLHVGPSFAAAGRSPALRGLIVARFAADVLLTASAEPRRPAGRVEGRCFRAGREAHQCRPRPRAAAGAERRSNWRRILRLREPRHPKLLQTVGDRADRALRTDLTLN